MTISDVGRLRFHALRRLPPRRVEEDKAIGVVRERGLRERRMAGSEAGLEPDDLWLARTSAGFDTVEVAAPLEGLTNYVRHLFH